MSCANYQYKIAVGADNVAGLALIDTLTDGTTRFEMPESLGNFAEGEQLPELSGGIRLAGFTRTAWALSMTSKQHVYWRTTYCAGGYSAPVTISTVTAQSGVYANYDAIMNVSDLPSSNRSAGNDFFRVTLTFVKLVVIPPPP